MFHLKNEPTPEEIFRSLYELVEYYKNHPVHTTVSIRNEKVENFAYVHFLKMYLVAFYSYFQSFHLEHLVQPVPPSIGHENEEWFYKDMTREESEKVLEKLPLNGAFLGRYSTQNRNEIVISFRYENVIKHCQIIREGRYLTVANLKFHKLEELKEHYGRNTFYRDIKLNHAIGNDLLRESQQSDVREIYYSILFEIWLATCGY